MPEHVLGARAGSAGPAVAARPVVLVLVLGDTERAEVHRAIRAEGATPVCIRPGGVGAALQHYRPSAIVVDLAHMATAPDDFFAAADAAQVDVVCVGTAGVQLSRPGAFRRYPRPPALGQGARP